MEPKFFQLHSGNQMSIAIELTETARDHSPLYRPVIVTRPKTKSIVQQKNEVARSQASLGSDSARETRMLALQLSGTFILVAACVAGFAFSVWLLYQLAYSAMDQIHMLSPHQILQGMAGR
jgi:hypothetical protein